ncbi:MAG: hypothetical protein M1838_004529 [Thelocarpon superellum]|nr:MAG: hypothetical protein M1838_004529 [Thelocarpon superellum]
MPPSRTFEDEARVERGRVTKAAAVGLAPDIPSPGSADDGIIDIRRHTIEHSIRDDLMTKLHPPPGEEKQMPTLLLYDETGLKLFEEITYLDEYYLTNAEIETLERYAGEIAERISAGSIVVELGSGNLRKVNILLRALEHRGKAIDYYALDLSLPELQRTLAQVPDTYQFVKCRGLHGTYDDGLAWLQQPANLARPKCILSLGSSIGNFAREDATQFLARFGCVLRPEDSMLIGLDACQDGAKVYHAYNDRQGVTHRFLRNGFTHANALLGREVFSQDDWTVFGEYDAATGRHHAFYSPRRDLDLEGVHFIAGERIRIEESCKYSQAQSSRLWSRAGLVEGARWGNEGAYYFLHMLSRPAFSYPLDPAEYAARPVPSYPKDWEDLWAAWDTVTQGMIPKAELLSKPIKLRNACIFYLGHIPCFLDIRLTRATDGVPTTPAEYPRIFERGIDPDVDNPDHCHAHSEIPEDWPPLKELLAYQSRVRNRVRALYRPDAPPLSPRLGRALWLAFEHEIMHLETLLYMLIQSDWILPPPARVQPDFAAVARQAATQAVPNEWFTLPERRVTLGLQDPEDDAGPDRYFGWDNEKPRREVVVPSFTAKARLITNGEYAAYLEHSTAKAVPASWTETAGADAHSTNGDTRNGVAAGTNGIVNGAAHGASASFLESKFVRTVYGPVPLSQALDWPVMASYDELARYAKWMNGRIPTLEETRSIYGYVDEHKAEEANQVLAKRIAAVNGHLSNDGVEESPPSRPLPNDASRTTASLDPRHLFCHLDGCNVGFQHWHPVPITQQGNRLCGQGEGGGAWEWTSSVLEGYQGFQPMALYPGYTGKIAGVKGKDESDGALTVAEDFFDGKHNVVVGGSWATHPRVAGRKTFVNWYQRNYPYAWAGARLVRDL